MGIITRMPGSEGATSGEWRALIGGACRDATFSDPASESDLAAVEARLGTSLPGELRAFLLETNGCLGEYSLGLIWSSERIKADNLSFRENPNFRALYMPFDPLLFFADAGNGDQFAYAVLDGEIHRTDIFVWNHEDDSRTWVAPSLSRHLLDWLSGALTL